MYSFKQSLTWTEHINTFALKISRSIGIFLRLRTYLPSDILLLLYKSFILPYIHYALMASGYANSKIFILQKKNIPIITGSAYLAHTDPLFKRLNLLKIQDMFEIQQLKFYHNYVNKKLPFFSYFIVPVQQPSLQYEKSKFKNT